MNQRDDRALDVEKLTRILRTLSERDRDALTRFYLLGQNSEQICCDLGLETGQFKMIKSRVKKAFITTRRQ